VPGLPARWLAQKSFRGVKSEQERPQRQTQRNRWPAADVVCIFNVAQLNQNPKTNKKKKGKKLKKIQTKHRQRSILKIDKQQKRQQNHQWQRQRQRVRQTKQK